MLRPWRLSWLVLASGACLPDRVPEWKMKELDLGPITLLAYEWPSAKLVSTICKLLIEEVLGYRAVVSSYEPVSIQDAIMALTGCTDMACSRQGSVRGHVVLETWLGAYGEDFDVFKDLHPDIVPVDLGSMGYAGEEAMFLKGSIVREAFEDSGASLDWYRSYNSSKYKVKQYFSSVSDLDITEFKFCNDTSTMWTEPLYMNQYAHWTGDLDGLIQVEGGYHARCYAGRFWLSPACRHNVSECIPVLSSQYGWLVDAFMAWSTAHGLPTAIGIFEDRALADFMQRGVGRMLSYWFQPDARASLEDLQPIVFPRHSASEWAAGNKRSAAIGSYIGKLMAPSLQGHSAHRLLQNLKLDLLVVQSLLRQIVAGQSFEDVSCAWINSSRSLWEQWVPKDTTCRRGFGMVDAFGQLVASRENATACGLCPPGSFTSLVSDEHGRTQVCSPCEPGFYQGRHGQSLCVPCPPGRISVASGLSTCEACRPGHYADLEGSTSCESCGMDLTTSREVDGVWVQVESADSASLCHCMSGYFLDGHVCRRCSAGARCGGGRLEVLPGYFSFKSQPGSIYKCHGDVRRCPGNSTGNCAEGRDPESLACGACLLGLRPYEHRCIPCQSHDYATLVVVFFVILSTTAGFHALLLSSDGNQMGLMQAGTYLGQLVVCLQLIVVIQHLEIQWRDPFLAMIQAFQVISLEDLMNSIDAVSCLAQMTPTLRFLFQAVMVPGSFIVGPLLLHAVRGCRQQHVLVATLGTMCMVFFIAFCMSLLEPFECLEHPNGTYSMRKADVLCNFEGEHLALCLAAMGLTLLPIGFLSLCTWLILKEFPRRLHHMDSHFIRSCSFLVFRFRPGMEAFSVFLMCRNAMLSVAPVFSSATAGCFLVYILLFTNLCLDLSLQPWRSWWATHMDVLTNASFLLILFQGAFYVENVHDTAGMVTCTVLLCGIILAFTLLCVRSLSDFLAKRRGWKKRFHYFVTHHKEVAGSLARLLKTEFRQRGFSVFLDCDDLLDLPQLFNVLNENVSTVLVLASPSLLTRKWCLAELVTARLQQLETVLILLPNFRFPDSMFISAFDKMIGELNELANYGLSKADVKGTLEELKERRCVKFPEHFLESDLRQMIQQIVGNKVGRSFSGVNPAESSCLILADQSDMEAVATAHVLRAMLLPHLSRELNSPPCVLSLFDRVDTARARYLVMVCTMGCLEAPSMVSWIMQSYSRASTCCLLPVVADEHFQVPGGQRDFQELIEMPTVQMLSNSHAYLLVIRAVFTRIALRFCTKSSSEWTLRVIARKMAQQFDACHLLGALACLRRPGFYRDRW